LNAVFTSRSAPVVVRSIDRRCIAAAVYAHIVGVLHVLDLAPAPITPGYHAFPPILTSPCGQRLRHEELATPRVIPDPLRSVCAASYAPAPPGDGSTARGAIHSDASPRSGDHIWTRSEAEAQIQIDIPDNKGAIPDNGAMRYCPCRWRQSVVS
jgi:hypothetical protein